MIGNNVSHSKRRTKRTDKKKEKRSFRYADECAENKAAEEKTVS